MHHDLKLVCVALSHLNPINWTSLNRWAASHAPVLWFPKLQSRVVMSPWYKRPWSVCPYILRHLFFCKKKYTDDSWLVCRRSERNVGQLRSRRSWIKLVSVTSFLFCFVLIASGCREGHCWCDWSRLKCVSVFYVPVTTSFFLAVSTKRSDHFFIHSTDKGCPTFKAKTWNSGFGGTRARALASQISFWTFGFRFRFIWVGTN